MTVLKTLQMPSGEIYDLREQQVQPGAPPPLWMVKESAFMGDVRNMPGIVNLLARPMDVTEQWQYYIAAINYMMSLNHISAIFNVWRAYCNGTGVGDPQDPRKNFILRQDLTAEDLQFDKARTNIRATHAGRMSGDQLELLVFDGTDPPPLKPGRSYPRRVEDARFDDYLFNPRDHRYRFFAANNYQADGDVVPWINGGLYPWFEGGRSPVTWLPLVANYPLRIWSGFVESVSSYPSPYYYGTFVKKLINRFSWYRKYITLRVRGVL